MTMDSNCFAKLMELEREYGFPSRHENKLSYFFVKAIDELMSCGLSEGDENSYFQQLNVPVLREEGAFGVISLFERLREEGLSQEEAMKVVKEEVEVQALEAKGMTRSDAQGVVELNDPNHPSNKGAKDASDS